jgi:hypothetical protein
MTHVRRPYPQRPAPRRTRDIARSPHRPSAQLIADAVIAGYIHDISERRRDGHPHATSSARLRNGPRPPSPRERAGARARGGRSSDNVDLPWRRGGTTDVGAQ